MTVLRLLAASVRAWYVVLLGAALTMVAGFWVWTTPGVYYAQVDVVFLQPVNTYVPNNLRGLSADVIATASVVQREVTGGPDATRVVSGGVTLVDEGIRSGQRITLPNSGGQWANNFDRALLDVQVVDRTRQAAQTRLDHVVESINASLDRRQRAMGADRSTWISTRLSPASPTISYVEVERKRAVVMTMLLGGGATGAAVVLLEARRSQAARDPQRLRSRGSPGALEAIP